MAKICSFWNAEGNLSITDPIMEIR